MACDLKGIYGEDCEAPKGLGDDWVRDLFVLPERGKLVRRDPIEGGLNLRDGRRNAVLNGGDHKLN